MRGQGAAAQDPPAVRQVELCFQNLKEIETLLALPNGVPDRAERICAFAYGITVHAPHSGIADLARKMRSEARHPNGHRLSDHLWRLKAELDAVKKTLTDDAARPSGTLATEIDHSGVWRGRPSALAMPPGRLAGAKRSRKPVPAATPRRLPQRRRGTDR
jgi:hypothetical protein